MANLTWKELKAHIETMDDEQINTNVTVYITGEDEFWPISELNYVNEDGDGVLDPFHPYLHLDY